VLYIKCLKIHIYSSKEVKFYYTFSLVVNLIDQMFLDLILRCHLCPVVAFVFSKAGPSQNWGKGFLKTNVLSLKTSGQSNLQLKKKCSKILLLLKNKYVFLNTLYTALKLRYESILNLASDARPETKAANESQPLSCTRPLPLRRSLSAKSS